MQRRHLKILGLSLLALVGVMAVSASAAQAKWLLLKNGVAVSDLKLVGTFGLSELLVQEPTIKIHCPDGVFTALLKTLEKGVEKVDGTVLDVSGSIVLLNCVFLDNEKNCTIKSPGAKAGEIVKKGEGTGAMAGEETYSLFTSSAFTTIVIEGALCPLDETEEPVSGSLKLTINNPAESLKKHTGKLVEEGLKFGENSVTLHGELLGSEHDPWVLGEAQEEGGATWAIDLVSL